MSRNKSLKRKRNNCGLVMVVALGTLHYTEELGSFSNFSTKPKFFYFQDQFQNQKTLNSSSIESELVPTFVKYAPTSKLVLKSSKTMLKVNIFLTPLPTPALLATQYLELIQPSKGISRDIITRLYKKFNTSKSIKVCRSEHYMYSVFCLYCYI